MGKRTKMRTRTELRVYIPFSTLQSLDTFLDIFWIFSKRAGTAWAPGLLIIFWEMDMDFGEEICCNF